jgi:hypothetical protein
MTSEITLSFLPIDKCPDDWKDGRQLLAASNPIEAGCEYAVVWWSSANRPAGWVIQDSLLDDPPQYEEPDFRPQFLALLPKESEA